MSERVAIFIDGNNLYYALRNDLGRTELDSERFVNKIVGEPTLVRAYYYNVSARQEDDEQRRRDQHAFFNYMRELPYFEDEWREIAGHRGRILRSFDRRGGLRDSISAVALFHVVQPHGALIGKPDLAPHDLRRSTPNWATRPGSSSRRSASCWGTYL